LATAAGWLAPVAASGPTGLAEAADAPAAATDSMSTAAVVMRWVVVTSTISLMFADRPGAIGSLTTIFVSGQDALKDG
jgi:hypothetical protein